MEKRKIFETQKEALDFCLWEGVKAFYLKNVNGKVELRYYTQDTKTFICDICGCITPYECEGNDPETCADCNPVIVKIGDEKQW